MTLTGNIRSIMVGNNSYDAQEDVTFWWISDHLPWWTGGSASLSALGVYCFTLLVTPFSSFFNMSVRKCSE